MSYQAPLRDMRFVLHALFDVGGHCALLGNGLERELIDGVLEEGARYAAAYRQYVDNGWAQDLLDEALPKRPSTRPNCTARPSTSSACCRASAATAKHCLEARTG